jgi:cytidine deaminase
VDIPEELLVQLAAMAWRAREHALVIGPTRVGCAVLATDMTVYSGCNVEHRFRSHDVHAEVNAITSMVAAGSRHLACIVIAAEREQFTPCGACMDWILQLGTAETIVAFQGLPDGPVALYSAGQLMPYYPK